MTAQPKRPPNDRGQGRKSLKGEGKSPVLQIRVTQEQKDKVDANGGATWVRRLIDAAT